MPESQRLSLRTVFPGIFVACLLGTMGQASAQRPVPVSPPPMAEPTEVRVYRGQGVEIPLRAGGRVPGPLRFLIRSQPTQGSLGEPGVIDKNKATITYTHDPKFQGGADSFRFAVQAVDSPVSAPAEVLIHIQDPPAKLVMIPSLNFGEVAAGSHSRKEISVSNTGGTSATVTPTVSLPWTLEDSAPKTVRPGANQTWTLVFSPSAEGNYSGEFRLPGTPPATTTVSGRAVELFSVSPDGPLILSNSSNRKASLLVKNRTGNPLTLQVKSPNGILVNPLLELPPKAEVSLELTADPTMLDGVSGSLILESKEFRKEIPVRIEAVPAIILADPAGGFQIMVDSSSQQTSRTLILKNQGGSPARLEARSPAGVVIVPDPASVIIIPGKSQKFEVSIEISGFPSGDTSAIEISVEGAKPIMIPLKIKERPRTAKATTAPTPKAATDNLLPTFPGIQDPPQESPNEIPAIAEIRLISKQPGEVQIAWTHPSPLAKSFVIEFRTLEYAGDDAPPLSKWSKFPYARFQESAGDVIATMTRLPANSSWFIRAVSLNASGKRSVPSEAVRVASPPYPPRPWLLAGLVGLFVAGAVGFVVRKIMQTHQTNKTDDAARISRLEGE